VAAVRQNGLALEHAAPAMKEEKEVATRLQHVQPRNADGSMYFQPAFKSGEPLYD